jgi:hypothetical protein
MAMRTCRECGKEISSEAKACPHCGVRDPGRRGIHISTAGGCAIIGGLLVLTCVYFVSQESNTVSRSSAVLNQPTQPPISNTPQLVLKSWSWSMEYGYAKGVGQVKNVSNQPLRNVEAVATFYDAKGNFITSADALIDYNPILPGQTSPFSVMATENPAMTNAGVEFKELMGGAIPFADSTRRRRR